MSNAVPNIAYVSCRLAVAVYKLYAIGDIIEVDFFASWGIAVSAYVSMRFALTERYKTEISDEKILPSVTLAISACREGASIGAWNLLDALMLVLRKVPLASPKSCDSSRSGSG